MSAIMIGSSLVSSGLHLQSSLGRWPVLIIYFGAGVATCLNELLARRWPRPVGSMPAAFAILVYACFLFPELEYNLYGMKLQGWSLILVQCGLPLLTSGPMFFERLPTYVSGILVGLASFVYFSEGDATKLATRVGIPLGDGKTPSSLAAPLLCLNVLIAQMAAQYAQ